jgi:serine/threonine protein phosphatase 1
MLAELPSYQYIQNVNRTFVIGDIHGACRALVQCLERSGFDYAADHLICLGDVCDGWPETKESIDELLKIKKLTYILGNHDVWGLDWMKSGYAQDIWVRQGGEATMNSYKKEIPSAHINLLERALPYFIQNNKLFVHAGFNPLKPIGLQGLDIFLWDRNLAQITLNFYTKRIKHKLSEFDEVYIGHTVVPSFKPLQGCEVWMMDTGAGWSGVLSMMDIDTKEIFASDKIPSLYPGVEGRKRG